MRTEVSGRKETAGKAFIALLISLALFGNGEDVFATGQPYINIIWNNLYMRIWHIIDNHEVTIFIGAVVFFLFLWYSSEDIKKDFRCICYSIFLGFASAYGNLSLKRIRINETLFQLCLFILKMTGYSIFFYMLLNFVLLKMAAVKERQVDEKIAVKRNDAWRFFITLLMLFLPHLLIKYPAGFCNDSAYQVDQGLGNVPLTAHHPVFHTILLTWFTRFGLLISRGKSGNMGMFIFVFLQTILLAAILTYVLVWFEEKGVSKKHLWFAVAFYTISPYVTGYIGTNIKDELYSILFILFQFSVIQYCHEENKFLQSKSKALLAAVSGLLGLIRHNGLFITIPFFLWVSIINKKGVKKRFQWALIALLPILINVVLNGVFKPQKVNVGEMLSVPFQQTARYVSEYNDITDEEKEAIDRVLPIDLLAANYNRYISDPIKSMLRPEATKQDLLKYFVVWFKLGVRHPLCYVSAFAEQNAQIFNPMYVNSGYYVYVNTDHYPWTGETPFSTPNILLPWQKKYERLLYGMHEIPIIRFIVNSAGLLIFSGAVFLAMRRCKIRHWALLYYPQMTSFVFLLIGPTSAYHPRYQFPMIYTIPLLFLYFLLMKSRPIEKV